MNKITEYIENLGQKLGKKHYFILVFLILVPILITVSTLFNVKVSAGWIDPEWQYRSRILISSHSSNENNVYVTIPTFDATDINRYQTDCGDLRFTKLNGEVLPYYVVDCDSTANIHVEFDTLPAGSTSFYMYYGNSSAIDGFELLDFTTPVTGLGTISFYSGEEFRSKPIAHWKLDENTGQSLVDSINGYNGTLGANASVAADDPTWATGMDCVKDSCLQFDASNDYIDAGSPGAFLFGLGDFAMTMWVNTQSTGSIQRLMERTNVTAATGQWSFFLQADGRLSFVSQNIQVVDSNCFVSFGEWNMVGFSRTSTTYDFFLNGKLCSSHIVTSVNFNTTLPLRMGGNAVTGANGVINGKLDDIKLYNRTFAEKEFEDNYNFVLGITYPDGNYLGLNTNSVLPTPIIHYKLDEQSGQVINNSISSSYPGTLGGSSAVAADDPTWQNPDTCRTNGCQYFGGSQHSNFGDIGNLNSSYSVSTWFKSDVVNENNIVVSYRTDNLGNGNSLGFQIDHNNANIRFYVRNAAGTEIGIIPTFTMNTGEWYHATLVREGNSVRAYINGILRGTGSAAVNSVAMNRLTIGGYFNDLSNVIDSPTLFKGSIDEVKIWNVALTSDEVKVDYNANSSLNVGVTANTEAANLVGGAGTAPLSEWKLDENTGTTANDTSTNSNNLTLNNGAKWVPGKVGSALEFDGIDDNATVANSSALNIGTSDFTVEAWIKGRSMSDTDIIMGKTAGGVCSTTYGYSLGVFDSLKPTLHFCTAAGSHAKIQSNQSLVDGTWYHIVALVDRDSTANTRIYVNGIPTTTTVSNLATHTGSITNTEVLALGSESDGGFYWDGALDQIRVYNYLRTASQIAYNYNGGEPVAWWKLDQTSGTSVLDYSGFNSHGTFNNMDPATDWLSGSNCRLNGCLDFDAVNDYVTIPANDIIQPTSSITVSAWYRTSSTAVQGIVLKRYAELTAPFNSYGLHVLAGGLPAFVLSTSMTQTVLSWNRNISDSRWHHITGVYDGTQARLYVDGKLVNSTPLTGNIIYSNITLRFGAGVLPPPVSDKQLLNGRLDEVKIFNYPLDEAAVKNEYNLGALRYE